jgi:uncharacterized protein (TIGR00255 family)
MTGYSILRLQTSVGDLTISLRSVNHRGLDLHFHHAAELAVFENAMRTLLKQKICRGHVEVRTSLARNAGAGVASYNRELLARYIGAFRQASREHKLEGKPDLNALLTLPGVFVESGETEPLREAFELEIIGAMSTCADALNAYREREARELLEQFEAEIVEIEKRTAEIGRIRKGAVQQFQTRLRERLQDLLSGTGISESRLAEEAALLADRSDVQEELTRLTVHAQELRRMFQDGGEVGKRVDFLLQEMNREANTVLSKTSGIGDTGLAITNLGLAIKAHIEKIREQALNLE